MRCNWATEIIKYNYLWFRPHFVVFGTQSMIVVREIVNFRFVFIYDWVKFVVTNVATTMTTDQFSILNCSHLQTNSMYCRSARSNCMSSWYCQHNVSVHRISHLFYVFYFHWLYIRMYMSTSACIIIQLNSSYFSPKWMCVIGICTEQKNEAKIGSWMSQRMRFHSQGVL